MRLAVVLAVLISVAAQAHAEDSRARGPRESRYGPTTPRQAAVAVAAATVRYDGPMLGWAGKRQASPVLPEPQASAPTRPTPIAGWAGYQATPAPSAYASPPLSAAPPTSLYAAPRAAQPTAPQPVATRPSPAANTPAPTVDWSNYRSSRVAAAPSTNAPAPAPLQAQPAVRQPVAATPPPQPRQVAAVNTGAAGARFYSVGREYGLTPDVIPPAGPDTRVLITAGEPPPEAKDAVPQHGSADWLAAGVNGDSDDDDSSAARRAKTRDQAL
ncbi:hypothetical protein PMI01_03706 [Caulobacter sp. AP07]|uniref:hypothetical protein n=1 Tax=Caulobacter sp. AP07 TaxID=1144304 RepID=UPI000271FCCE|nr:hypothetical protein [Caulobacter sp. AP07]EJL27581.1 hypothetical protein PMI01_03706 [Caulobacter sp. AP07]